MLDNFKMDRRKLRKYIKAENFFNRELSWLEFNRRVLEEALNPDLPLLDRVKFVSIFFSNLDEYYMIRVSGIKKQIAAEIIEPTIDGLTPEQELEQIEEGVTQMLDQIYYFWESTITNELRHNNILIEKFEALSKQERDQLTEYFTNEIYPVLTPLAFDPGRPFPYISNLSLSLAIQVQRANGEKSFARVKIPSILPRLIRIDNIISPNNKVSGTSPIKYIWLEDLIESNLHFLFPGLTVLSAHRFRITRDTDIEIQEDEADDLLEIIEENIKQRRFGMVVRLEVDKDMPDFMLDTLIQNLLITKKDVHIIEGPLGLSSAMELYGINLHQLKEKPFHPVSSPIFEEEPNIFNIIKHGDVLLHHPYDSFKPVIDFIKQAAADPNVLAIKQTLYRMGKNSPIIKSLIEASEAKKQVAVLVELKARFDEENNIYWAKELEKAGIHVVYGLVGLKTHSKMTLIVRKEEDGVKRYVHLGTGNYNASTAKLYTDMGLLTNNPDICADVNEIFNYLTGYSEQKTYRKCFIAPHSIRETFLKLIAREVENAHNGKEARIVFKMNSLVDPSLITALYEASCAGVKIDLIIRGICCLVPSKPGLSENIRVISIVGRFLEHSRIYYFLNGGNEEIYMGSADLMQRNIDRRVETMFPVLDEGIKRTIKTKVLDVSLMDNEKARVLLPNGRYVMNRKTGDEDNFNLQEWHINYTINNKGFM